MYFCQFQPNEEIFLRRKIWGWLVRSGWWSNLAPDTSVCTILLIKLCICKWMRVNTGRIKQTKKTIYCLNSKNHNPGLWVTQMFWSLYFFRGGWGWCYEWAGLTPVEGRGSGEVKVERILSFVLSRRVESDRTAVSLPSSPDPFKTPSRTSPLLPLPPYPPPEHTSRDGSGKTSRDLALYFSPLSEWRTGITQCASARSVGRGMRLFPGIDHANASELDGKLPNCIQPDGRSRVSC